MDVFPSIIDQRIRSISNRKDVSVHTRTPLSKENKEKLSTVLNTITSSEINIKESIDPEFSPGFIAKFDNFVLDATLDHVLWTFNDSVQRIANSTDLKEEEGSK